MILKRGVTSLDSISDDRTWLGFPKRFALYLYGEILREHPELDDWLPRILERHQTHLGAYKRTADRRFEALDEAIFEAAQALRPQVDGPLRVHDLAVSDGRTSVELLDRLAALAPIDFTASDRDSRVDVVARGDRELFAVFDERGHPVQFGGRGFVVSPPAPESLLLYPLNRLFLAWFERSARPAAEAALREASRTALQDFESRTVGDHTVWRVPLISRACRERVQAGEMTFIRQDLLEPLPGGQHLLRVMNALNHLDAPARRQVVHHLRDALVDGGLLVEGRTQDPGQETRATVWKRQGNTLVAVTRQHGGSELAEEIETAFRAGSPEA